MEIDILKQLAAQSEQIFSLAETVHRQAKQQGSFALRDLVLLKVLILELEVEFPRLSERMQKRLDTMILEVGDDQQLCSSIAMANSFLSGFIRKG